MSVRQKRPERQVDRRRERQQRRAQRRLELEERKRQIHQRRPRDK